MEKDTDVEHFLKHKLWKLGAKMPMVHLTLSALSETFCQGFVCRGGGGGPQVPAQNPPKQSEKE